MIKIILSMLVVLVVYAAVIAVMLGHSMGDIMVWATAAVLAFIVGWVLKFIGRWV